MIISYIPCVPCSLLIGPIENIVGFSSESGHSGISLDRDTCIVFFVDVAPVYENCACKYNAAMLLVVSGCYMYSTCMYPNLSCIL